MRRLQWRHAAGILLLAGAVPLTAGEKTDGRTGGELANVDRIQQACLRAYPPDYLEELTGSREIPGAVDENPELQQQFFDRDVETQKGIFYPSLLQSLIPAFERWLRPGDRFLDLGSGDGRVVFLATHFGAEATGIEYDPRLVAVSRSALDLLKDEVPVNDVRLIEGDFFEHSWAAYEMIYYFDQGTSEQQRLRRKLANELSPGGRLVVWHELGPFPGLELEAKLPGSVTVYRQPVVDPPPGESNP